MTESYNTGLWEVTLEEDAEDKLGLWEVTLEADVEDELGLWTITLEADEAEDEEEEVVEEVEEENIPFDKNITLTTAAHQILVTASPNIYSGPMRITLPEGFYVAKAVSGGCRDVAKHDSYWTWHVAGSAFEIVNGYSLVANAQGYGWTTSQALALASVADIRRAFYWEGGTFSLWLPTNDVVVPTNNDGSCTVNLKKVS